MRQKIKNILKGSEYEPYINQILQRLERYGNWANMQNAPRDGHIMGGRVDIFSLIGYLNENEAKGVVTTPPKATKKVASKNEKQETKT